MTTPVQIPADVDREDRLLGDLTARQLIILTTTALAVYLVWTVTGPTALIVFAVCGGAVGPGRCWCWRSGAATGSRPTGCCGPP